jgi:CRISPR-associated protein Cas5d
MKRGDTEGLGLLVDENRQQRAALILVDVAYVIEAHFSMTDRAGPDDSPAKHAAMFQRRAAQGQCFHRPCLGTREFAAEFALLAEGDPLPASKLPAGRRDADLGWMLHDIDFTDGRNESRFFRAEMRNGVIDVPPFWADDVAR